MPVRCSAAACEMLWRGTDKGARFMDIVSHMELMADCIDPLTMVRDRAAIGICRGACVD